MFAVLIVNIVGIVLAFYVTAHTCTGLIEHGFTSAPTQYRLYGQRFLQVWWPNQQCQSTEGRWIAELCFCEISL